MKYKTINTDEEIPEELYIFQFFENTPIGRIYKESFDRSQKIFSAGISNLENPIFKEKFLNGEINYTDILNENFSCRLTKFGFENINNEFEVVVENYRKNNFPHYPSRLSCIYAFEDFDTCKLVSQLYKWDLNEVKKFKIVKLHSACKTHMEIISTYKPDPQLITNLNDCLKKYWMGEKIEEILLNNKRLSVAPIYEYLIEGVLEEIK